MTVEGPNNLLAKWVIAVSIVLLVVIGGYAVVSRDDWPQIDTSAPIVMPGDLPEQVVELAPADGKEGSGQAQRSYRAEEFSVRVVSLLPELEDGASYIVKLIEPSQSEDRPEVELGKLDFQADCGCFSLEYRSTEDRRTLRTVQIIRTAAEKTEIVLEGTFDLYQE